MGVAEDNVLWGGRVVSVFSEVYVLDLVSEFDVGVQCLCDAGIPIVGGLGVNLIDFSWVNEDVKGFFEFEFLSEVACDVSVALFDPIFDDVDDV